MRKITKRVLGAGVVVWLTLMAFQARPDLYKLLGMSVPQQEFKVSVVTNNWKSLEHSTLSPKVTDKAVRWAPGSLYNDTCKITLSSRQDRRLICCHNAKNYTQLHWVSEQGPISLTETKQVFWDKIYNKTVLFVGDSITNQLTLSMWDLLEPGLQMKVYHPGNFRREIRPDPRNQGKYHKVVDHRKVNFTYLKGAYISTTGCVTFPTWDLPLDNLRMFARESDIILFNMGLHYETCTNQSYRDSINNVSTIFKEELTRHPEKQVIIRSTTPQHYAGYPYYTLGQKDWNCQKRTTYNEHWTNKILKSAAKQYGFKYMNSFPIYMDRWDLHFRKMDCTHSCVTAEVIVPEMALLNSILK